MGKTPQALDHRHIANLRRTNNRSPADERSLSHRRQCQHPQAKPRLLKMK
jgi:hypothetical protein